MKHPVLHIFFLLAFLTCCHHLAAQAPNRYNKKGQRTGKWVEYADEEKKTKTFEGRYRKGRSVGRSYYYVNGTLERYEIYRFRKMKTTFFHPNGKIRSHGNARIELTPEKIHYFYYGKWKMYDEHGQLLKYCYYKKGELQKTKYIDKNNLLNDSLIASLNAIDREFDVHTTVLKDSINTYWEQKEKRTFFKNELKYRDSVSFAQIERIISIYGYPSKKIASDASLVPFYVLSFAPVEIREKYAEVFTMAMYAGDISPKAYAFFVDKLRVAKKEKQVYGTQYYYDKQNTMIYYPSEDPANLNKRRESVGLEPL